MILCRLLGHRLKPYEGCYGCCDRCGAIQKRRGVYLGVFDPEPINAAYQSFVDFLDVSNKEEVIELEDEVLVMDNVIVKNGYIEKVKHENA